MPASGRYVLVNTAAQQLYMYDDGRPVDWMRVVVGKPVNPTPMMAATISSPRSILIGTSRPTWRPSGSRRNVVKQGLGYLHAAWAMSSFPTGATRRRRSIPSTIDWQAVADGRIQVRIRQNPGPHNAMGRMKFMFPNPQGIYLHDTPDKELLNEAARLFSGGCVRLEDAPRLAKWLYGQPLDPNGAGTEQPIDAGDSRFRSISPI